MGPARTSLTLAAVTLFASTLLSGCNLHTEDVIDRDVSSAAMSGKVFGGQQPVSGATVRVYQMGTSGYGAGATLLATTTTDSNGNFAFTPSAYTCAYSNAPVYILASGGNPGAGTNANIAMAAGLGTCASAKTQTVNINEVSTVVTAYALSHFFTTAYGGAPTTDLFGATAPGAGTYSTGLVVANSQTIPTLVSLANGTVNPSTSTTTIEAAKIYSLANSLASCINSTGQTSTTETTTSCGKLFSYTTPVGGTRPADTLQAAVRMALYPYLRAANIFNLASTSPPFGGGLVTAPNDLTIGVSYTSSTLGLGINGTATSRTSSNIDIDASGNVWFPSTAASAHGLAYFSPSTGSFNGPYATALVHPQYVAIDRSGAVWGTDLAGARIVSYTPSTQGTTSYTTVGFTGPVAVSYGSSTVDSIIFTGGGTGSGPGATQYRLQSGTITPGSTFTAPPNGIIGYGTSSLDIDVSTSNASSLCRYESYGGSVGTRVSTSTSPCYAGGVANELSDGDGIMTTSTNELCIYGYGTPSCFTPVVTLNAPEGVAVDGDSNVWVANSGNASVSTLGYNTASVTATASDYVTTSTLQYIHNTTNGNTLTTPYGVAVDRSGNVWISNAGCVTTSATACTPGAFVLSELIGAAAPTLTPLAVSNVAQTTGSRPTAVTGGTVAAQTTNAAGLQTRTSH